jgi:hypothetical protein
MLVVGCAAAAFLAIGRTGGPTAGRAAAFFLGAAVFFLLLFFAAALGAFAFFFAADLRAAGFAFPEPFFFFVAMTANPSV